MPLLQSRYLPLLVLILLVGASAGLYIPWIDNPLVFDDPNLLKSPSLGDYAVMPFSLQPRQFPYFTLGFEQVISNGNLHVSRYVALLLHGLNGFLLFLLSRRLLARATTDGNKATFLAFAAGLLFVVHPVSVYAAGYLIQRTILFATFFLLLSAIQFDKALTEGSWRRAVFAGLCYGMAAMSKEHAMPGFLVVSSLIFLRPPADNLASRKALLAFLATCLPIAVWIMLIKLGYVATAYEPDVGEIIGASGFPDAGSRLGNWALSAALQAGFFFRYAAFWLWPDPAGMSIDIRPDFAAITHGPWLLLASVGLFVLAGCSMYGLASRRIAICYRLIAFGLCWMMVLFFVELAAIRFQEPIVLYRSYLWAPGLLLALASLAAGVSARFSIPFLLLGITVLCPMTQHRLVTFSKDLVLWKDALDKTPQTNVPGIARIHYNIGQALLNQNETSLANNEFIWLIEHEPRLSAGYLGRSNIRIRQGDVQGAISDLERSIKLKPDLGLAYFRLGILYQRLGDTRRSEEMFAQSEIYGFKRIVFIKKQGP